MKSVKYKVWIFQHKRLSPNIGVEVARIDIPYQVEAESIRWFEGIPRTLHRDLLNIGDHYANNIN